MKISTKGRYALRMLCDLALHYEDGFISLKDIAERQSISRLCHLLHKYQHEKIKNLRKIWDFLLTNSI